MCYGTHRLEKHILSVQSHCWSICLIHWEVRCFWRCVLWRENDGGKCLNDRGAETDSWKRCLKSISTGFNCYLLSFQILIQSIVGMTFANLMKFVGVANKRLKQQHILKMMISQETEVSTCNPPIHQSLCHSLASVLLGNLRIDMDISGASCTCFCPQV